MTTAYSYIRFSNPSQEGNDSVRRQETGAESYTKRKKYKLDKSLNLRDLGVSGFKGANVKQGKLGVFLSAIESGKVKPGSVLIMENTDRATRMELDQGDALLMGILRSGVRIATLSPEREYDHTTPNNFADRVTLLASLMRGHEEPKRKSELLSAAWGKKKQQAAKGRPLGKMTPPWVRVVLPDGKPLPKGIRFRDVHRAKFVLVPKAAETVRQVFKLAMAGKSIVAIARELNESGIAPLGWRKNKADTWGGVAVHALLINRAVIGEYQPKKGGKLRKDRQPDGEPILKYFPRVVTDEVFYTVQEGLSTRRKVGRGRKGKHVNLFAGLLKDGRDGATLAYHHGGTAPTFLFSINRAQGRGGLPVKYPADSFERTMLKVLRELDPREVFAQAGPDPVIALSGKLSEVKKPIDMVQDDLEKAGTVQIVLDALRKLQEKKDKLEEQLRQAQGRATSTPVAALDGVKSLSETLGEYGTKEQREKAQAALRRLVERIDCWFYRRTETEGKTYRQFITRIKFVATSHPRTIFHEGFRGTVTIDEPVSIAAIKRKWADGHKGFLAVLLKIVKRVKAVTAETKPARKVRAGVKKRK